MDIDIQEEYVVCSSCRKVSIVNAEMIVQYDGLDCVLCASCRRRQFTFYPRTFLGMIDAYFAAGDNRILLAISVTLAVWFYFLFMGVLLWLS